MKLIVHAPSETRAALQKTAAKIHADTVIRAIRQLPCSAEEKLRLLDRILASAEAADSGK